MASVVLQSGARWLGLTLDMIGAVIVFPSVLAAILMDQTNPASLGLLISYRSTVNINSLFLTYRLISKLNHLVS